MFRSRRSVTNARGSGSSTPERDGATSGRDLPRSGRITELKQQQRDRERISVFLDGEFAFGLNQDLMLEAQLHIGMELDEQAIESLLARDLVRQAISAALSLLAYRPRSEGEIRTRLRQRGFSDAAITGTIDKLREWRYIDDRDFAERWVENRLERRPRAARMIAMELRGKGVAPETVGETMERADIDERGDAFRLASERWSRLASLEPVVRHRRITGFLSRRGYGFEIIREVLAALEKPSGDEDPG